MAKINWSIVLQRCQPQSRQRIIDLRSRHEDLTRQLNELRDSLPSVNWAAYRAAVGPEAAQQIDRLEVRARQFKPTIQDCQPALLVIEKERSEKLHEAKLYLENLERDIVTLKDYLGKLETLKDVDEITVDDIFRIRPDLKERFDSELERDHWGIQPEPPSRDHSH